MEGIIPAVFTPFRDDGELNLGHIPRLVDHLVASEVDGIFVCGTSGEWSSLETSERELVSEAYVQAVSGKLPTIVHVGDCSLRTAKRLARHAQIVGAEGISALPPFYFRANDERSLADGLAEVAEGAPDLPFYYYHLPSMTGVRPDLLRLIEMMDEVIPNFAGVKFSEPDLSLFRLCLNQFGHRLDFFFGVDGMLCAAFSMGARGAIGSTYNFMTPLVKRMLRKLEQGSVAEAAELQGRAVNIIDACVRMGGLAGLKAVMGRLGLECGPVRSPQASLSHDQVKELHREVERFGLFE